MEIDTGNYSSLSNQKDENLRLKCIKIRLAVGLHPNPLGSLCASPDLLAARRGPTSKRAGEGKGRRGAAYEVREGVEGGKGRGPAYT